jgi:hypothetical protein
MNTESFLISLRSSFINEILDVKYIFVYKFFK